MRLRVCAHHVGVIHTLGAWQIRGKSQQDYRGCSCNFPAMFSRGIPYMALDRRTFLQLLGSSALAASLPASIAKALTIPANNATGTIEDVEHIVFLMQENRSFDHYFGTLQGCARIWRSSRRDADHRQVGLPSAECDGQLCHAVSSDSAGPRHAVSPGPRA